MATEPATETTLQGPAAWEEEADRERVHGLGPWQLGLRRLRRNKVALLFGFLFVLLVALVPGRAAVGGQGREDHAHGEPPVRHIKVDGKDKNVVGLDGVPIGPQWLKADGKFFLGADRNGRDIMVRLLYGGRNSLMIGVVAAVMTTLLSIVLGMVAGYFRGWTDTVIRALLDIMWSFPVIILGMALGRGPRARRPADRSDQDRGRLARDPDPDHRRWSTSRTWRDRCAARCSRCARRSSWRPRVRRAPARSGSCSPRSCRTSRRRSSSSSRC